MAKVLIVDDEQGLRNSLGRFVKYEGHEVYTAEDAEKAIAIITQNDIDVVVSDIIMPKVSGVDLLKTLATDYPTIKVILITGEPTLHTASEALRLGAFDYLSKPITKDSFLKVVSTAAQLKTFEDEKRNYNKVLEKEVKSRTAQLLDYSKKLKYIAENLKRFSSCKSIKDLCVSIMQIFSETMECYGGSMYLKEETGLRLMYALDSHHQDDFIELPLSDNSVLGKLYNTKKGFIIKDINKDGSISPSGWRKYNNGSFMATPIFNDANEVIGSISLHNRKKEPFADFDLDIAQTIAANFNESLKTVKLGISLRESEEKYRKLTEQSRTGIFVHQDDKVVYANSRLLEMTQYSLEDLDTFINNKSIFNFLPESDVPDARKRTLNRLTDENSFTAYEMRLLTKTGDTIWVDTSISKIDHNGKPATMGNLIDITEKKKAEEAKERLEEELRHSQKMEAIGRLAGGVAHDFNNLLTGITGNISLALLEMDEETPLAKTLLEINAISKRAANLTRQLLAFSRKQILEPKVLNLNNRIKDLNKMLVRIIGEDVKLVIDLQEDLWSIKVDPGQVEQIIVNLSVNARDAMPNGGTLTLQTQNINIEDSNVNAIPELTSRQYIKFSIIDDGNGIDEEILPKIFEPFFTTKPREKGTGLGLSTVYGIIKQHNGHIEVESQKNKGTKFEIYFPRTTGESANEYNSSESSSDWPKGTETILLAEDENMVRTMTRNVLKKLGYNVIESPNGKEALELYNKNDSKVDLLLTDVVMPGINGPELAKILLENNPQMKVLYTSGYTNEAIIHHGVKDETVSFIGKPYSPVEMAHKVREVLDN